MDESDQLLNSFTQWEHYSKSSLSSNYIIDIDSDNSENNNNKNNKNNNNNNNTLKERNSFKYNIHPYSDITTKHQNSQPDKKMLQILNKRNTPFNNDNSKSNNIRPISLPMDFRTINDDSTDFPMNIKPIGENKPRNLIPLKNNDKIKPINSANTNTNTNTDTNTNYTYNYRIISNDSPNSSKKLGKQRPSSVPINIHLNKDKSNSDNTPTNKDNKKNRGSFNSWFISSTNKDFTSNNEFSKFKKNKKFIFHKGFIKNSVTNTNNSTSNTINDCKISSSTRKKDNFINFKNKSEFNSYMNYINLSTINNNLSELNLSQPNSFYGNEKINLNSDSKTSYNSKYRGKDRGNIIIASPNVAFFKPTKSQIVINQMLPKQIYLQNTNFNNCNFHKNYTTFAQQYGSDKKTLGVNHNSMNQNKIVRKISLKKSNKKRNVTIDNNNAKTIKKTDSIKNNNENLKNNRIKTRSQKINSKKFVKRSNTLPNKFKFSDSELIEIWSKYLQKIIMQRIMLRINLLNSMPKKKLSFASPNNSTTTTLSTTLSKTNLYPVERLN